MRYAAKNYGNASLMEVKESIISGNKRFAYVKFTLTGQQAVSIAQVKRGSMKVFKFNEGYYNRTTMQNVNPGNIDGSLYDADYGSVGVVFQYSYSHDNSEGLWWGCNTRGSANNTSGIPDPGDVGCTVRYNVSQNDKGDLIFFNYPSAGNEIYNNVLYIGAGESPIIIHESSKQHTYTFRNNIIYNLSPTADYAFKLTGQTRTISHNIFYGYHPVGKYALFGTSRQGRP